MQVSKVWLQDLVLCKTAGLDEFHSSPLPEPTDSVCNDFPSMKMTKTSTKRMQSNTAEEMKSSLQEQNARLGVGDVWSAV